MSNSSLPPPIAEKDSLALYYKDVEGTRMLSALEEKALIRKYHTTKDAVARDLIVKGALRYVISEARKYPRSFTNRAILKDLIAAGNVGLLRALEKFDPEAGTRFLTYAGWWVRHEMREEGRKFGLVHIPAHALTKGIKSPITIEYVEHAPIVIDIAAQEDELNFAHAASVLLCATALSIREAFIIKTCYGVHTAPKTLKQIGKILGITGERVRQLRESALIKLRSVANNRHVTF